MSLKFVAFFLGLCLYSVTPYMNKIYILETNEKQQNRRGDLVVENSPRMLKIGVRSPGMERIPNSLYILGSDT